MYLWRRVGLLRRYATVIPSLMQKKRTIKIRPSSTVSQISETMGINPLDALRSLKGIEENQNLHIESVVSVESAQLLAFEFNFLPKIEMNTSELPLRPPIVTIMGHVDHGKTTLLDSFRNSSICSGEYGGITQGIGAFSMVTSSGQRITFIDTPGHKAFSKMRERGAHITDIVILVVCAVEGVQPQTREALDHAKDAGVPIIVALNKIDLPGANPGKVELQLMDAGLDLDKLGGETMVIPISAKKRTNLDRLEEALLFKSELMELKEDPSCIAQGTIIESKALKTRGHTCSALVRRGTLRSGDIIVAGKSFGKIKSMANDAGQIVAAAGPSEAVEIVGLEKLPEAGDDFFVVSMIQKAKFMCTRMNEEKKAERAKDPRLVNTHMALPRMDRDEKWKFRSGQTDVLLDKMKLGDLAENTFLKKQSNLKKPKKNELARIKNVYEGRSYIRENSMSTEMTEAIITNEDRSQVYLVLKANNKGMLEALITSVYQISGKTGATIEIVRQEVGNLTPEDIQVAEEFGAVILGMDISVSNALLNEAKSKKIALKSHKIIYHLLDDVQALAADVLAPPTYLATVASAEVKQLFPVQKGPVVVGVEVRSGAIHPRLKYKVLRNGAVLADNLRVSSLKRHKQDVKEVPKGMECGLTLEDFSNYKEGDIVEGYELKITEKQFRVEQVVIEAQDVKDK